MSNVKKYGEFKSNSVSMNESFWTSIFGKPSVDAAAHDAMRGQGFSFRGRDGERSEDNYIMFNGTKFYPDQIEYDDYHSTKPLPRVEGDTLIIANPAWSM